MQRWFQQSCKFGRLRCSSLTLLCTWNLNYIAKGSRSIEVPPAAKTVWTLPPMISQTPVPMLTGLDIISEWPNISQHDPTIHSDCLLQLCNSFVWRLRLLAMSQKKRCLTWTNTPHSCKSCTCNLVICTSQDASMTLPASWHALQSFSVVLGSPVRIAARQLYLDRCRRYKRTKSVSRKSKNQRISISSI